MPANFNKVIVAGTLTKDVELRHLPSGLAVATLRMAINDRRKNQAGDTVEETCFVDVTMFARQAEVASEYLERGSNVLIEGRLRFSEWEDRESGAKRSKHEIIGDRMQMLGGRGEGGGGGGGGGGSSASRGSYAGGGRRSSGGGGGGGGGGGNYDDYSQEPAGTGGPSDDDIPF